MREDESVEDYTGRLDVLADKVSKHFVGEDIQEIVLVLTRLTIECLDQVEDPRDRRGMIHVIKVYYDAANIHLGEVN